MGEGVGEMGEGAKWVRVKEKGVIRDREIGDILWNSG